MVILPLMILHKVRVRRWLTENESSMDDSFMKGLVV